VSFRLFNLRENEDGYSGKEFSKAMDAASDHTSDWIQSLTNMMRRIALTNEFTDSTGLPLYRSRRNGTSEVYRPSIRSFRRKKAVL
jgi:hypothetical protein